MNQIYIIGLFVKYILYGVVMFPEYLKPCIFEYNHNVGKNATSVFLNTTTMLEKNATSIFRGIIINGILAFGVL